MLLFPFSLARPFPVGQRIRTKPKFLRFHAEFQRSMDEYLLLIFSQLNQINSATSVADSRLLDEPLNPAFWVAVTCPILLQVPISNRYISEPSLIPVERGYRPGDGIYPVGNCSKKIWTIRNSDLHSWWLFYTFPHLC